MVGKTRLLGQYLYGASAFPVFQCWTAVFPKFLFWESSFSQAGSSSLVRSAKVSRSGVKETGMWSAASLLWSAPTGPAAAQSLLGSECC